MADKITEESLGKVEQPKSQETATESSISDQEAEQIAEKSVTIAAVDPKSLTAAEIENFFSWKRKKTQEMLESEPKVRIFIPFNVGEDKNNKANQYAFFGINGFYVHVRKGMYVDVPKTIADMHMESVAETERALDHENSISNIGMKIDPTTGQRKTIDAFSQ